MIYCILSACCVVCNVCITRLSCFCTHLVLAHDNWLLVSLIKVLPVDLCRLPFLSFLAMSPTTSSALQKIGKYRLRDTIAIHPAKMSHLFESSSIRLSTANIFNVVIAKNCTTVCILSLASNAAFAFSIAFRCVQKNLAFSLSFFQKPIWQTSEWYLCWVIVNLST